MRIRARAPLRVSYAGGGTDVPPYPELAGGVVLSSTIKTYAYCTVESRDDEKVTLTYENSNLRLEGGLISELPGDSEVRLVKAVAHRFSLKSGFDISLRYDALPGAGLGSSSALCVSLIGAFKEWKGRSMTDYDIATLAYEAERKDAGVAGGMQDQYASTFGGFNLIEFRKEGTIVNPLRIRRDILHELEYNSLLCFSGSTRRSGGILNRQIQSYQRKDRRTLDALEKMKKLTFEMKDLLLTGNLTAFAKLLNSEWELKRTLDQGISTPDTERLLSGALNSGAIGGKLLGAGGGGFLFVYCESGRRSAVERTVESLGGRVYPVLFDKDGLQVWRTPK